MKEWLGVGLVEFDMAAMMPLTSLPPVAKRAVAANIGGSAVTLTNICLRSRLSASAGLRLLRAWREVAETAEPSETNETSIRGAAADDGAAERHLAD